MSTASSKNCLFVYAGIMPAALRRQQVILFLNYVPQCLEYLLARNHAEDVIKVATLIKKNIGENR